MFYEYTFFVWVETTVLILYIVFSDQNGQLDL